MQIGLRQINETDKIVPPASVIAMILVPLPRLVLPTKQVRAFQGPYSRLGNRYLLGRRRGAVGRNGNGLFLSGYYFTGRVYYFHPLTFDTYHSYQRHGDCFSFYFGNMVMITRS